MLGAVWYNARVRSWVFQIALIAGLLAIVAWIAGNTVQNLVARGIRVGFGFLERPARFPISESVLSYNPTDTFLWAYVVGVTNTLYISAVAIVLSTVLGLFVGLARRSTHPLLSRMAGVYVSGVRNMPLIVQLLFWYALAITAFPAPRDALNPLPGVFLTQRGIFVPQVMLEGGLLAAAVALATGLGVAFWLRRQGTAGRLWKSLIPALVAGGIVLFLHDAPLIEVPALTGLNFRGGLHLSPEFVALILGLVFYTAAFIGEIIRGGIDAVSRGQWEASRALGLTERQTLRRVIIPQALRVIIPPLTSQYLSTAKNTTLALAVGYPELGLVVGTVINQTGQAIESILILLGVFLTISVSVSVLMNWYNAHVALVER